jgi:hypothetical protein
MLLNRIRFRSGDACTIPGVYHFDGYPDGTRYPLPVGMEEVVVMRVGSRFPIMGSCGRECFWIRLEDE